MKIKLLVCALLLPYGVSLAAGDPRYDDDAARPQGKAAVDAYNNIEAQKRAERDRRNKLHDDRMAQEQRQYEQAQGDKYRKFS